MFHVLFPITSVPVSFSKEVVANTMSLPIFPFADIKVTIIVKAFSEALSAIIFPRTNIFVVSSYIFISAGIYTLSILDILDRSIITSYLMLWSWGLLLWDYQNFTFITIAIMIIYHCSSMIRIARRYCLFKSCLSISRIFWCLDYRETSSFRIERTTSRPDISICVTHQNYIKLLINEKQLINELVIAKKLLSYLSINYLTGHFCHLFLLWFSIRAGLIMFFLRRWTSFARKHY